MQFRSALVFTFATLGLALGSTAPAFAHAALTGTSPESKASVTEISEVSVSANEDLLDIGKNAKGFVLTVRDKDGRYYGDGCVTVDGVTASTPVALTEPGTYRVDYRIVSNDGHPIEGMFKFTFAGVSGDGPAPAFAERPKCGVTQEPVNAVEANPEPTEETTIDTGQIPADDGNSGYDATPWIGLATIPVLAGAIWLLVRVLGKKNSEDHLN